MIFWLPVEPLAQRYTAQMHRWVTDALKETDSICETIRGQTSVDIIGQGEWLDTCATSAWKTEQVLEMTKRIASGDVRSGDVILVGDVWFPGIETLKFQCDLLGLKVKFAGWHCAGCFDPHDYLAKNLGSWSRKYEAALLEGIFDEVCFGSHFHQEFVSKNITLKCKPSVFGSPWNHDEVASFRTSTRNNIIVYNHRWADEKRWWEFVSLATNPCFKDWQFAYSTNGNVSKSTAATCKDAHINVVQHKSKNDYYDWLSQASAVWSGADQETFGYSFMEAIALGVPVVAPNRLSYKDHFVRANIDPREWLYETNDQCGQFMLLDRLNDRKCIPSIVSRQYHLNADHFIQQVTHAS